MKWIWIILAVIYLLSPYDLIPGFHPAGWLDDIVVLVLLLRLLSKLRRSPGAPPFGHDQKSGAQSQTQNDTAAKEKPRTAHEILGLEPGADEQEIRAAYRKLANQYHPDKVTHLGDEFRRLAEQRFKEIQAAYDELRRS